MPTLLQSSPKTYARLTGLLYLIIAIAGGFSMGYVPTLISAPGDAAATASNIIANKGMFQLGIFADMVVFLCELMALSALYMLSKPISQTLALIAAAARLAMTVVIGINVLFDIIPLVLLSDANFLAAFSAEQLNALVLLCVEIELYGVTIWQMFFTVHLLLLGWLVYKSGYLPRLLGAAMMIGSLGYALNSIEKIAALDTQAISIVSIALLTVVTIAEVSFTLWLLIKGLNVEQWKKRIAAEST